MSDVVAQLVEIVGTDAVLRDELDHAPYAIDWRKRYHGRPLAVVCPATTAEVAAVVRACAAAGTAIVAQGGNTGLAGGATPDSSGSQVLLSLRRLRRVRDCDPANQTITVEAGCTLAEVQRAAADHGRLFPLSLAAEGTCTIGGNLATNAGGTAVLRYGNARELTLGLEVVLADGTVWDGLRGLRKNNTGYDLKQLFIGAEGTLGVITAAVLRTFPQPAARHVALTALPSPRAAVALLGTLQARFDAQLTGFELFSEFSLELVLRHFDRLRAPFQQRSGWYALIELSGAAELQPSLAHALGDALTEATISGAVVAASAAQARDLWSLRENISEAQAREGTNIKHDVAVPTSAIPEFIDTAAAALEQAAPGMRLVCFGHLGDGNLHFNVSAPVGVDSESFLRRQPEINRVVHDCVAAYAGTISAEHGIGQLRREELLRYKQPVEIAVMRAIKAALDPRGIFNPGKIL